MECLDANIVQDLRAGALDSATRSRVIDHVDGCRACRELLGGLVPASAPAPANLALMETVGRDGGALLATVRPGDAGLAIDAGLDATALPTGSSPPVTIRAPDQIGRTLGRYTVIARLGAGAMGVVYRAEDRELGRDVALKQLHRPDEELTERLVREARSMAQVNHPNVVAVYDVGVIDHTTYIAMELVTGHSLRSWQQAARTVPEIVEAYLGAGRGLAAAHASGIVHRDFKPDNVLVGNDGRIRVTDFGLAAARTAAASGAAEIGLRSSSIGDVNLTTSGSVLGTPAYMAPEQFQGGHVDARTDQFNFCVALYEALYGERPFTGKTFPELCDTVCEGRVQPAPAGTKISGALRKIVLRGLAVKPGDRYPTMDHLLTDLGKDRARPLRITAGIAAVLAAMLALGLIGDLVIRDRLESESAQSFAATARQTSRAVRLLAGRFDAISNQVYSLNVMRDVTGHHDAADFGLGSTEEDDADLEDIHQRLASADWTLSRAVAGKQYAAILAVSDHKGRLLYTSAAPETWRTDLRGLPSVARALEDGSDNTMTLMRYDHPALVASGMLGPTPPTGLAVVFTRTLRVGDTPRSQFLQIIGARQLLDDIRLDDETQLSLISLDGAADGDDPPAGAGYETETILLHDPLVEAGAPIGRLVMARASDTLLALFPHARIVFAIAMLLALVVALGATLRGRAIAGARV